MAVMSLRWLVAASALLPPVSAGTRPNPRGPVQTAAPDLKDANIGVAPRVVTDSPAPRGLLQKRATNTCGYVDGDSNSQYVCAASNAECIYNTEASALGCCLSTSCRVITACKPYTSGKSASVDERTRYCSNSNLPSCAVFSFADPEHTLSGYTIHTCDSVSTTYTMFLSSSGADASSSTSTSSGSNGESTGSPTDDDGDDDDDSNRSPVETGPPQAGAQEESSSTPVGAIVGGVVGGIAAIALVALAVFFLRRRKNQNPAPSPSVLPGGPVFMPPPGQGHYDPNQTPPPDMAAMAYDPRYSTMKPPGASSASPMQGPPHMGHMAMAPGQTPPLHYSPQMQQMGAYPHGVGMPGTPPPPGHSPHNQFVPYPAPPMHMQQQPGHAVAELSAHRSDGPVHEMQ